MGMPRFIGTPINQTINSDEKEKESPIPKKSSFVLNLELSSEHSADEGKSTISHLTYMTEKTTQRD